MRYILRTLLMLLICQMIKSTPSCKPNQMRRRDKSGNYICCFTVICRQGQTFAFCEHDQSFDTCSNCPEGTYHLDTIDTSKMNTELDPCIPKPTCEQPEVRLENGKCICDRSLGYYGNDIYNCMLAEMKCSSPGFELKDNGKCEPCAEDFFKPEASTEHICRRKSSCHESQDIANNGSTTTDRSCKARTIMNLPAIKLTTENNDDNNDKNNMSNGNDERYSVLASIMERLENLETEFLIKVDNVSSNFVLDQSTNEQQNDDVVIGMITVKLHAHTEKRIYINDKK
ncbi:unnamed protein product [Mytilus coruscus]|uniref:TNFR-Cys domain-containing protein n=1 Tax=Mytilus coruscus TaxID=42192 RepID=A0A6J8BGL8_MYTCO|nr:unnamed protein product [Mytilus coruscus]